MKKEMGGRLQSMPTKTGRVVGVTKRQETISSIKNAVSNLPVEVDNWPIRIKEEKLPPRSRPIKDTERRKELFNTVRWRIMFR